LLRVEPQVGGAQPLGPDVPLHVELLHPEATALVLGESNVSEELTVAEDRPAPRLLEDAEAARDRRAAIAALRECRASIELISKLRPPKTFDGELTPSPLQMAEWTEIAAEEFVGCPQLADQFAHELADAFFKLLGKYVPKLQPGAGERLVARVHELDKEHGL
jgi:hypothetical protein